MGEGEGGRGEWLKFSKKKPAEEEIEKKFLVYLASRRYFLVLSVTFLHRIFQLCFEQPIQVHVLVHRPRLLQWWRLPS